ncbi:MAG: hypothetical protein DMG39_21620 [Acidobacteria bacterium]|nr:MAG: hypothetical protein DMG39_21620 [Acidobacteriota bacterium]
MLYPFPFQFGNFFDPLLHQVIVINRLANALVPCSRDTNLAKLALLALNQVQGLMQLAAGAATIWFPALTCSLRERAAEEPLAGGQLRNPGTEIALGGREFGAVEGPVHLVPC